MSNASQRMHLFSVPAAASTDGARDDGRLLALVAEHLSRAARIIRTLGAPADDLEDLVQQAFSITAARLRDITPGKERSFLIATAVRLAGNARKEQARRRRVFDEELHSVADDRPSPEELWDQRRARETLDGILDQMDEELRTVFVLFEVEEVTMAEIAAILQIPAGTVASRLRRAREDFLARVHRLQLSEGRKAARP